MYEVHVKGFKSLDEAQQFASWYEGQGEQMDICVWMECRKDEGMDVRTFLPTKSIATEGDIVTLQLQEG